jgi:hypothetical protein
LKFCTCKEEEEKEEEEEKRLYRFKSTSAAITPNAK